MLTKYYLKIVFSNSFLRKMFAKKLLVGILKFKFVQNFLFSKIAFDRISVERDSLVENSD